MKFAETIYNKIWASNEGRQIITKILQNPNLIRANHTFWTTKFKVDPQLCIAQPDGTATFVSRMREIDGGTLMDMRAPLGDSIPEDIKGLKQYTGTIPSFIAKGTVETAPEREYKEKIFEQFGDAGLVAAYATDVLQRKLDGANQTLSHMSAQLLSTGKIIYKQGEGIQGGVLKAEIPAENFVKAGEKVWTDTKNCKLIDQMIQIEQDFQEKYGINVAMQWELPRDMFLNVVMKNAQVIEWVRYVNVINNTPLPEAMVLPIEKVQTALAQYEGLSPIVIIEEKQNDLTNGLVHGWDAKAAVLRPQGYAGLIRHTLVSDVEMYTKYGNNVNTYTFTPALQNLAVVANSVIANGNFKEWHTDLMMNAVPSLDEFLFHVIVDTTQANA